MADHRFAGYSAPFIYADDRKKKLQQLIWGDYVALTGAADGDWVPVHSRRTDGWMRAKDLQEERILEICFVDIGQGDGALLVTPDDQFMLVDAGETDNMYRFLSWRFNLHKEREKKIEFPVAVISHPDQDHYKGFGPIIKSGKVKFGTVYHNGIVERTGDAPLGPRQKVDGVDYLSNVVQSPAELKELVTDPAAAGRKPYPNLLAKGLTSGTVEEFVGTGFDGQDKKYLKGFGPHDTLQIEVLGPCLEDLNGSPALRYFGDPGKTKNGHSVVLRLVYGNVRVLLGGDLNTMAERHLLTTHTGADIPDDPAELDKFVDVARQTFEVDVAKACHHGSADYTSTFLRALNPLATIVSSGDDESYAHPRPDALGAFGKYSRGERPLIFSTELARSAKENIKKPETLRQQFHRLVERRDALTLEVEPDDPKLAAVRAEIDQLLDKLERSIAVYGMINLRTDGEKIVLAQKLEATRGTGQEWDVHCLEPDATGELAYVSKHDGA